MITPTRRQLLKAGALSFSLTLSSSRATAALPDPRTFQAGDLLWPKDPGKRIPYGTSGDTSPDEERAQWEREKVEFLAQPDRDDLSDDALDLLQRMTFEEFVSTFTTGQVPGQRVPHGMGEIAVGHVALVDKPPGKTPWIIEAMPKAGVVRVPYADWLKRRTGQIVWQGRVKNFSAHRRSEIASVARTFVGRPYRFFSFRLDNDRHFYCSKLIWLSVSRSLGISLDGKQGIIRFPWLSPKQLLYSASVSRLFDPGDYAEKFRG